MTMDDSEAFAFRERLGEYLDMFMPDIKTEASRRHFRNYLTGLLGDDERKNMERMAFKANPPAHTLQDFLAFYVWDEDAVRRRVRRLVAERFADANAIAIIDGTGIPKKGAKTAGVQRQYCGARGKIENSVMFVGLAYAAGEIQILVDLELYLPKTWAESKTRRREAGIPDDLVYRSKRDISVEQLRRAKFEGMAFRWATADEFYGRSSKWRR
jgi:SRSO17 transposase